MTQEKAIDRINKLLRLARDGGATEAEADVAMAKAQLIMAENNLTMATVEAAGEAAPPDAKRQKTNSKGRAMYRYQQKLMSALATVNFCSISIVQYQGRAPHGYQIIGRESNVVALQSMFDYLNKAINRLVSEALDGDNSKRMSKFAMLFCEGASDRLCTRLERRHRDYLRKQAADARAAAGGSTANALTIVLADYANDETDLNNDFEEGWPPGTTKAKRAERRAQWQAYEARKEQLIKEGMDPDLASLIANGYDPETAARILREREETPEQQAARERREKRDQDRWSRKWFKEDRRKSNPGYRLGERAGEAIGLDPQVRAGSGNKQIGG